jgi:L-alanine-DL-glutamate epimerase-like enolase superfamily enzyme
MTRIVRIDSYHTPWVCFVKLTTEDGSAGWGQASPYAADMTAESLRRLVAPIALGKDSTDIESTV